MTNSVRIYFHAMKVFAHASLPSAKPVAGAFARSAGRAGKTILLSDGKSADRQEYLTVMAGGSQTCGVAFPTAQ
jgi:hypothetical protein